MSAEQELPTCGWCGRYLSRHMGAYYYGFGETGAPAVDRILCSVAAAGKAYHHTESWGEPRGDGEDSYVALIQRAANNAAAELSALRARVAELERLARAAVESWRDTYDVDIDGDNVRVRSDVDCLVMDRLADAITPKDPRP